MKTLDAGIMRVTVARADDLPEDATRAFVYSPQNYPRVYAFFSRGRLLVFIFGWLPVDFFFPRIRL